MFQQIGAANNFVVIDDVNGSNFNSVSNLAQFDLIVFSNTSGNALLDSAQRSNFESYMQAGGALLGIHAATDTYRHSTANGNLIGAWDFYAETMGGSVQQNPNHVAGTPNYSISKLTNHPIIDSLPNPWMKDEEYYYWENGYLAADNIDLLQVETTIGPNGLTNSYDSARTVAWYKISADSSRIFYTSLGHSNSNYSNDSIFQQLITSATQWCLRNDTTNSSIGLFEYKKHELNVFPIPAKNSITLQGENLNGSYLIYDITKKILKSGTIHNADKAIIDISGLNSGVYFLQFFTTDITFIKKIMKE